MKKKEWYELLAEYNCQITMKKTNDEDFDAEYLNSVKEKICGYITEISQRRFLADAMGLAMSVVNQGYTKEDAKEKAFHSWVGKWAIKTTNILSAIENEERLSDVDTKETFYGIRMLDGRLSLMQYFLLLAGLFIAGGLIAIIF